MHCWCVSVSVCTGAVYLSSSLSHLGSASVKFSISAQDGEGQTSAQSANVTVHILHSDQAPAMFQRSHYTFSVSEDAPIGTTLGIVQALNPASEYLTLYIAIADVITIFEPAARCFPQYHV